MINGPNGTTILWSPYENYAVDFWVGTTHVVGHIVGEHAHDGYLAIADSKNDGVVSISKPLMRRLIKDGRARCDYPARYQEATYGSP